MRDFLKKKEKQLAAIQVVSDKAFQFVDEIISALAALDGQIDSHVADIEQHRQRLNHTCSELLMAQQSNKQIMEHLKSLAKGR